MRSKNDKAKYDMDYQKSKMTRVTVWFNLDKDVERHIKYTKKIKLNARRHNVKFRSIQII